MQPIETREAWPPARSSMDQLQGVDVARLRDTSVSTLIFLADSPLINIPVSTLV